MARPIKQPLKDCIFCVFLHQGRAESSQKRDGWWNAKSEERVCLGVKWREELIEWPDEKV